MVGKSDTNSCVDLLHDIELVASNEAAVAADNTEGTDNLIPSLSNGGNVEDSSGTSTSCMTSEESIIITSEGIVFPPGTLMLSDNQQADHSTSLTGDSSTDTPDFNIKVENNPLKSASLSSNIPSLSDNESNLQNITFINGDHITQFHIQTPLSINDVQNLQKISNRNVLMSQAALPEDSKDREQHIMIHQKNEDQETESKQFLHDTIDDTLFIKHEGETIVQNNEEVEASIKSENFQPLVYIQVEGEDGNQQIVALTENLVSSVTNTPSNKTLISHDLNDKKKTARKHRRIKPFTALSKETALEDKIYKSEKLMLGGKCLPLIAPKMQAFPAYTNAQACIGNGKSLLKPYNLGSLLVEGGQYFEVLGRCAQCFRFSRTTSYCRAEKNHRDPKSSVCLECEAAGLSTVVCRRKLNHTAPNALPLNIVINTALQQPEHIKQLCIKNHLPPCFSELQSIVIHHADITFVGNKTKHDNPYSTSNSFQPQAQRKPVDYARGYLFPFSKEKWNEWLEKFCKQTSTNFRVRTGKRVNKKSDHGLANHNGKVIPYRTLETQLYNCALGGKPRKRRQRDGIRKRKERGSKLIGCSAVLHTRVIQTENNWCALEITVPKILAHLSSHDPRVPESSDYNIVDINDFLLSHVNATQLEQNNLTEQKQQQQQQQLRYDFVPVQDNETEIKKNSLIDEKKRVKNLLLTCASMVDMIENEEILTQIQESTQAMINKVLIENNINTSKISKQQQQFKNGDMLSEESNSVDTISHLHEIARAISQVDNSVNL